MRCPKCDAELVSEQKVCVMCGAYTPASGYFYQDRKTFHFTKNKRVAVYVTASIFLLLILYWIFRIVPPQTIAQDWINALCSRKIQYASSFVTEDFQNSLAERFSDMRELSDNLYLDSSNSNANIVIGEPEIRETATVDKAIVQVAFVDGRGQCVKQMQVELVKVGRKWKVNDIN